MEGGEGVWREVGRDAAPTDRSRGVSNGVAWVQEWLPLHREAPRWDGEAGA